MKVAALAAAFLLLLAPGCGRFSTPQAHRVYAAWEEGLTLGYEDPSQADAGQRARNRLMVRVKTCQPGANGSTVILSFTALTGQSEVHELQKGGGVRLLTDTPGGIVLLPEGFPERVSRWESRGVFNWVVGRAMVQLPGLHFATPADATGVWVESFSTSDPTNRSRTLYLPDLGEAETLSWDQAHWRWVATNRLVTRGFTDVPAPAAPAAASPAAQASASPAAQPAAKSAAKPAAKPTGSAQ